MDDSILAKAKEYIHAHLKEEFSLGGLAQAVGYSTFHLAREFKQATGLAIMEYTRQARVHAAADALAAGQSVCDTAMAFCFDTHAGFTRAFSAEFGCTPKEYREHAQKMKTIERGIAIMEDSKIVIRHICKDDVQDLWENVYSAMTPRQITEDKIQPAIEGYKKRERLELVAQVDGRVVMSLPLTKPAWIPLGFVWDNNFTLDGGDGDKIMQLLLDEMKRQAKSLGITALLSPQETGSEASRAMQSMGFEKVMKSGEWEYLMMAI